MRQWISVVAVLAVVGCSGSSDPGGPGTSDVTGGSAGGAKKGSDEGTGSGRPTAGDHEKSGADSGVEWPTPKPEQDAGPTSADAGIDNSNFVCGHKGDKGNAIGVGKYCEGFGDCFGSSKAILCAVIGDPNAHFCTFQCTQGSTGTCGDGASCRCQGSQCGCVPDSCK